MFTHLRKFNGLRAFMIVIFMLSSFTSCEVDKIKDNIPTNGIDGNDGQDGSDGTNGTDGQDGRNGISQDIIINEDSPNCFRFVQYRNQKDENGEIDPRYNEGIDELVSLSEENCVENGTNGTDGQDGSDGRTTLIRFSNDGYCVTIEQGFDSPPFNNILDDHEVNSALTTEICFPKPNDGEDGEDGEDGTDGQDGEDGLTAIIEIIELTEGEYGCEFGGLLFVVGYETNGIEGLQEEEITQRTILCNMKCVHMPECRLVEDTYHCDRDEQYILWLLDDNNRQHHLRNLSAEFYAISSSRVVLRGQAIDEYNITYDINVTFIRYEDGVPEGSPKEHRCFDDIDTSEFVYYDEFYGTIGATTNGHTWVTNIWRIGEAFQVGVGANVTGSNLDVVSASGWFGADHPCVKRGDFNFNICVEF